MYIHRYIHTYIETLIYKWIDTLREIHVHIKIISVRRIYCYSLIKSSHMSLWH